MKWKTLKRIILYIFAVMIYMASPVLAGFEQNTSSGLSWLIQSKLGNEYWGRTIPSDVEIDELTSNDVSPMAFRDSSLAAATLALYNSNSSDYQNVLEWIKNEPVVNTEYLSRRIVVLVAANIDISTELTTLLSYRNKNGGFGGYKNAPSNALDSAFALQALKSANYSDTALLGQSLNYLTSSQNSDGGWGFATGDVSNAYVTSIVLRTLSAYNSVFINQTSINNASSYLLTKQNPDGGFGSSPSNVYETSLSIISLIESGQCSTSVLQSAINYLTTTQIADGSWNEDPYSTALALQALASARANLTIASTDISLSKSMPQESETITITATVRNTGLDNASNVIVRFYLGDPASGGTQIGTDQIIPAFFYGLSVPVSVNASFTGTGGKTVFVVVDPDDLISETSKADNKASARLWVATGPDLAVFSDDLKPSTYVPTSGTAFTLNYTIRNQGESAADGFDIALYDGDLSTGSGQAIQTAHISGLAGSEVRTGTLGVTLSGNGSHMLYLVADTGNAVTEISETKTA